MGQIHFDAISKSYYVAKRTEGLRSAVKQFFNKKTTEIKALNSVSFDIVAGELVGYIGPNGAGKSTTIKIMSGILTPTEGQCTINGYVPWKQRKAHVAEIGVVFGQRSQLWWDVPVIDSFGMLKDIYKVPDATYEAMLGDLTESLKLDELLGTPVRQLSLGQRMRCELAASLLHNPKVLFLDEPTIGLDAVSKLAVRDFIKRVNEKFNTTVILTTHDMDDIEAICNRVIVIGKGEKLFDGTLSELRKGVTNDRNLVVDFSDKHVAPKLKGADLVSLEGQRALYRFDPDNVKASELIQEVAGTYQVEDVFLESIAIEEVIAKLYEVHAI